MSDPTHVENPYLIYMHTIQEQNKAIPALIRGLECKRLSKGDIAGLMHKAKHSKQSKAKQTKPI